MKKLLSILLTVSLFASCVITAIAAPLPFTDVTPSDWFYNDVLAAYESGIINGKTATTYAPNDNMTYAEAIKLAACMNMLAVEGKATTLTGGATWYEPYVNYCKEHGIIAQDYDYNTNASRSGYMDIFAKCLPEEMLPEINYIEDGSIPDVPKSASYAKSVYTLYRAGIVTGVDDAHNCNPNANIRRSEVAAVVTRMNDSSTRKKFTMGEAPEATKKPVATEEPTSAPTEKPLTVEFDASAIAPMASDKVTLSVKVSGGTDPYQYDWQLFDQTIESDTGSGSKNKYRYGEYVSASEITDGYTFENGKQEFFFDASNAFCTRFSKIRCIVTDADGNKVETAGKAISYGGNPNAINELATDDFVMYVDDVFVIQDQGIAVTGKVLNGKAKIGDALRLMNGVTGEVQTVTVKRLEMFKKSFDMVEKGDTCGIMIDGLGTDMDEAKTKVNRGDCLLGYNNKASKSVNYAFGKFTPTSEEYANYVDEKAQIYVNNRDYTGTFESYIGGNEDTPVNYAVCTIYNQYGNPFMYVGQQISIRKGGKTYGTITIDEVKSVELEMSK